NKVAAFETEKTKFEAKIAAFETEKAQFSKDLTESKSQVAKLETEAKNADERAREIAARAGVTLPGKKAQEGDEFDASGTKTINRDAFNKLSPRQQTKFVKDGGRLTD